MKVLPLLTMVCVALAVFIGTNNASAAEVPDWYYNSPCQQEGSLEQWLPWALPIEDYELGVFDCSELSAYAEWLCENCGYDTVIVVGSHHAWVIVEGRVLDAQTAVWDAGSWLPLPEAVLENIDEAQAISSTDWDWWIAKPELRGG